MLKAIPLELKQANEFVNKLHRHHSPVHRDKYRVGCIKNGELVGVVQVGRPVSRFLDDGLTLEVVRLCSNGEKDVCSFLYGRAARIAKELGYKKIITYILDSESGVSVEAAGWQLDEEVKGHSWSCPSRPRITQDVIVSTLFGDEIVKKQAPTCDKKRYCKYL